MIINRRNFLSTLLGIILFHYSLKVKASSPKEIDLSISVATLMRSSINDVNPSYLVYPDKNKASYWFSRMDLKLRQFVSNSRQRTKILINVNYESSRAGLSPQLILGLIEVESAFNIYAISPFGARGLMQVMPFWVRYIGDSRHNLFDIKTNLRYGCTILKYYIDLEKGNLFRALGRYNGSLGKVNYPQLVFNAYKDNWHNR